ncbi:hypothetical protein B4W70_12275, partial [Staphylococcus intermedius]
VGLFRSTDFRRAMKLVICWSVKEILPVKMIISYIFSDFATEPSVSSLYSSGMLELSNIKAPQYYNRTYVRF